VNLQLEHFTVDVVMGKCLKKLPSCGKAVVIFYSLFYTYVLITGVINGKYLQQLSLISSHHPC